MNKGDIILIPFPFTNLSGSKKRPALILISGKLDLTVSFISTQLQWQEPTDLLLQPNISNGLKKTSLVRLSKIATIEKKLAIGKLGSIDTNELSTLDKNLIHLFAIKNK